jgi:hypothetical protein
MNTITTIGVKVFFIAAAMIISILTLDAQTQKGGDIDGEAANNFSGESVSMPDANTIAIGAKYNSGGGIERGHVRVYSWSGTAWVQKGLDIDGESEFNNSGWSVSMPDANTIAIGAPRNYGGGYLSGHVRVYTWSGTAWVQKGVDIDGESAYDRSGWSVSMPDANTIAIGAPYNVGGGIDAGHVRVYNWSGNAWVQKGADIDGDSIAGVYPPTSYDISGWSVSMPDANTLAIGAIEVDGGGGRSGRVRVYTWNGTAWQKKGVDINGEAAGDRSGWSVSMPDANTIAIGAQNNDGGGYYAGHVRVYTWSGTAWVQKGVDIDGEALGDRSGWSVSMPDANTLAIGAPSNDGGGIGTGHVRVYTWSGTAWVQKGVDIDGEAVGDESGFCVSMPDANTIAIGAVSNDGGGIDAGHVRVYSFATVEVLENIQVALLELYPNPASNILNVVVDSENLNSTYSIFDNTGRVVLTGKLQSEVTSIQLGDLPSGVYAISVGNSIRQTFQVSRE